MNIKKKIKSFGSNGIPLLPAGVGSGSGTWKRAETTARFSLPYVKSTLQRSRSHWHSFPGSDFFLPPGDVKFFDTHPVFLVLEQSLRWTTRVQWLVIKSIYHQITQSARNGKLRAVFKFDVRIHGSRKKYSGERGGGWGSDESLCLPGRGLGVRCLFLIISLFFVRTPHPTPLDHCIKNRTT